MSEKLTRDQLITECMLAYEDKQDAEATATRHSEAETRLRGLLRRCNDIMPACPECKGNLTTWHTISENRTIRVGHDADCELAAEVGDE